VIRSVRVRIALAVFATIVGLLGVQLFVVLERVERTFQEETDRRLIEELDELGLALRSGQLATWIDAEARRRTKWDELFFEVRDANERLVAASSNVPPEGMPATRPATEEDGVRFREEIHPASRKRHRLVRLAEVERDGFRLQAGASLKYLQKRYWALRWTLFYSLLVIAGLGTGVAYGAATWVLRPLGWMAKRARDLGALREGDLPRTHSGDEIDQLAAVLNEFLRRLRDELTRVRRLTADAGHALRTPLTALRGHLELEAARAGGDADGMGGVLEDVDRLIRLVNDTLALEKLESGNLAGEPAQPLDAGELARELVDHLSLLAEDRGVTLLCRAEKAPVLGRPAEIRRALLNLLDNALRHTPRGGSVEVTVSSSAGLVRIAVRDSGPGLAPEDLERVFERFYSSAGEQGTGLGLPIARAIARAHGGELRASSPGGALFELELPAEPAR
jgi:signal transduction histidine kinase